MKKIIRAAGTSVTAFDALKLVQGLLRDATEEFGSAAVVESVRWKDDVVGSVIVVAMVPADKGG